MHRCNLWTRRKIAGETKSGSNKNQTDGCLLSTNCSVISVTRLAATVLHGVQALILQSHFRSSAGSRTILHINSPISLTSSSATEALSRHRLLGDFHFQLQATFHVHGLRCEGRSDRVSELWFSGRLSNHYPFVIEGGACRRRHRRRWYVEILVQDCESLNEF